MFTVWIPSWCLESYCCLGVLATYRSQHNHHMKCHFPVLSRGLRFARRKILLSMYEVIVFVRNFRFGQQRSCFESSPPVFYRSVAVRLLTNVYFNAHDKLLLVVCLDEELPKMSGQWKQSPPTPPYKNYL